MLKSSGAARDTQAKGRAKKLWKASFGKPYFFERAKCTLGGWTAAPIFAWIIIHKPGTGQAMALERQKYKGNKEWSFTVKEFIQLQKTGEFEGHGRTAIKDSEI